MKYLKFIYLPLMLLVSNIVAAQSIDPPNPKPPPPGAPIDSMLWILAIVAISFGIYMLRKTTLKSVK